MKFYFPHLPSFLSVKYINGLMYASTIIYVKYAYASIFDLLVCFSFTLHWVAQGTWEKNTNRCFMICIFLVPGH
jgi:hypothetical protein